MSNIIVGTAGHIDHGKTALVKALTGIDADRLKEEKERGITIDIGFASLALDAATTIGFIDVPGHERFVKNMLAGVGGIDVVMLVIAADESVMPQTKEHLDICSLLHIRHGLTVLTKIDATDRDLADLAEVDVRDFLKGSFLERAPLLRVSAVTGEGIPQLVEALREIAGRIAPKDASQVFRLPIDRCFTMRGFGTVVAGTLMSGRIAREDDVEILPRRRQARVRGVQVHGTSVDEARAGQRTALNLQRIELEDVERGMVVVPPGVFTPSATFDVHLELLATAPGPLVKRKRIRFHIGTVELMGHAILLGQDRLEPGQSAFAQIRLEQPTLALPGDRFIVRQYSPMVTIGGGEILDARPRKHRRSDLTVLARLEAFRRASLDERVAALITDAGGQAVPIGEVVGRFGMTAERAASQIAALAGRGEVRVIGDSPLTAVDTAAFGAAEAAVLAELKAFHEREPLVKGMGREDLKGRVMRDAPAVLFKAVIEALVERRELAAEQDVIRLFSRTVTLDGEAQGIRDRLTERFRTLGLQAPAPDDVLAELRVDRQTGRRIVQLMIADRELVKINDEMTVAAAALDQLVNDVRGLKVANAKFGVREFKDLTGLSRKFAMPLLEYLDGQRVTRRVGDERIIL